MAKDLLNMDRLPTMEELKEQFKKNDWTTIQISDPATRTEEERAEIAYVAAIMDKKFEELARQKGRPSSAKYYGEDNPLIVLQRNTEDLVASAVVKIANDDKLLDGVFSGFDFTDPDIEEKVDRMFHNAVDTVLDVMEYDKLDGFENHPFSVKDDEDMQNLVKSISENGVLVPCIVRENGERYELISGHRRKAACESLGIATLPIIIKDMTREEAIITMVDSNIQREHILPSEKAFAYKMKMDALSHQGKTSTQVVSKLRSNEKVGEDSGESRETVRRYIRLTYLNKQLLDMVDEGRIAFTPAVELSYLNEIEQQDLVDAISECDATPNLSQACRFKKMSTEQGLTPESISEILSEQKANQKERIKNPTEKLRKYFPKNYTLQQMEDEIIKLCENNYRTKQRDAR